MGGDNAPEIVIKGIEYFLKHEGKNRRARFLLHGDEAKLKPLLEKCKQAGQRSEIRHTESEIAMDEKPSVALRKGKGSSMWNAIEAIKNKEANIAVSAGNTGALMAISKIRLRNKQGVQRPPLGDAGLRRGALVLDAEQLLWEARREERVVRQDRRSEVRL